MNGKGKRKIESVKVRLDPGRRGYYLGDELRPGFVDDPALPREQRVAIAQWAQHFTATEVSEAQEELLAAAGPPLVSDKQRHLLQNQRELRTPYLTALFESLEPGEQRLVQDPALAGPKITGYPLSVGQMCQLTGATERQIRKWADDGVLPSYREGSSRRFYSAAVIRAFALVKASNPSKVLASAAARGEVGHHFQLLAATLGRVAREMPTDLRVRLNVLAEDLSSSSRLMADVGESDRLRELWQAAVPPSDSAVEKQPHTEKRVRALTYTVPRRTVRGSSWPEDCDAAIEKVRLGTEPGMLKILGGLELSEADRILYTKYGGKLEDEETFVLTAPRDEGEWVNQIAGQKRAISVHHTEAEALERGREIAQKRHGKHVVYLEDGSIALTCDYGT